MTTDHRLSIRRRKLGAIRSRDLPGPKLNETAASAQDGWNVFAFFVGGGTNATGYRESGRVGRPRHPAIFTSNTEFEGDGEDCGRTPSPTFHAGSSTTLRAFRDPAPRRNVFSWFTHPLHLTSTRLLQNRAAREVLSRITRPRRCNKGPVIAAQCARSGRRLYDMERTRDMEKELKCFLSHKCGPDTHLLGLRLRSELQRLGISLLRDPFNPGEDVFIKIETQKFDSFVFLDSAASWESAACQRELEVARVRGVPIISVLLDETTHAELRHRICFDARPSQGGFTDNILRALCAAISAHSEAYGAVHALGPEYIPEETRKWAQFIFDTVDSALIAEHLQYLAASYTPGTDLIARYWIALAIGKAGSRAAAAVLDGFGWEDELLPQEGIRQARQLLSSSI